LVGNFFDAASQILLASLLSPGEYVAIAIKTVYRQLQNYNRSYIAN